MNKIVKVIFQDGTELKPKNEIKPLVTEQGDTSKWILLRNYEKQFLPFEDEILEALNQDNLEEYAVNNFDLIDENDVEKSEIYDFGDHEILEEVRSRKLFVENTSIISENFITRFAKIINKENQILLDNLLTEFEKKLNL